MLTLEEISASLLRERVSLIAFYAVITRSFHSAEDVYQDVFVKLLAGKSPEFQAVENLLSWARTAGRHRAIDLVRARDGRYDGLNPDVLSLLAKSWPNSGDHDGEFHEALVECLDALSNKRREIVRMRYYEGLNGIEVARTMGMSLETLYQSLTRIHRQLRECVSLRLRRLEGNT